MPQRWLLLIQSLFKLVAHAYFWSPLSRDSGDFYFYPLFCCDIIFFCTFDPRILQRYVKLIVIHNAFLLLATNVNAPAVKPAHIIILSVWCEQINKEPRLTTQLFFYFFSFFVVLSFFLCNFVPSLGTYSAAPRQLKQASLHSACTSIVRLK